MNKMKHDLAEDQVDILDTLGFEFEGVFLMEDDGFSSVSIWKTNPYNPKDDFAFSVKFHSPEEFEQEVMRMADEFSPDRNVKDIIRSGEVDFPVSYYLNVENWKKDLLTRLAAALEKKERTYKVFLHVLGSEDNVKDYVDTIQQGLDVDAETANVKLRGMFVDGTPVDEFLDGE